MRPRGEVRQALSRAFFEHAPCGWRDVLPMAPVDVRSPAEVLLVRRTVECMVQAGEIARCGSSKAPGSRVWRALYEPVVPSEDEQRARDATVALDQVTRSWATFI